MQIKVRCRRQRIRVGVEVVAEDGVTQLQHVYPQLMGATGNGVSLIRLLPFSTFSFCHRVRA